VLGLLAAGIVASVVVDALQDPGHPRKLPWRDLTAETGPLLLPRELTHEFISRPQLAAYLRSRGGRVIPDVDFPSWRAALITLGPRSTTSYALRVRAVTVDGERVVIKLVRRNASLENPGRPKLTFPYRLITFPTTGKPIHIEWEDRR
jgi:hypothetical protein